MIFSLLERGNFIKGKIYFLALFVIQTTEGRKNLGDINKYINEDVPEILRYALNDMGVNKYISVPFKILFL